MIHAFQAGHCTHSGTNERQARHLYYYLLLKNHGVFSVKKEPMEMSAISNPYKNESKRHNTETFKDRGSRSTSHNPACRLPFSTPLGGPGIGRVSSILKTKLRLRRCPQESCELAPSPAPRPAPARQSRLFPFMSDISSITPKVCQRKHGTATK